MSRILTNANYALSGNPVPGPVLANLLGLYKESTHFKAFKDSLSGIHVQYMSDLTEENQNFISDTLQGSFLGFMLEAGNLLPNDYSIEPFINVNFSSSVCTPTFVAVALTVMLQDICHLDIGMVAVILRIVDNTLTATCE